MNSPSLTAAAHAAHRAPGRGTSGRALLLAAVVLALGAPAWVLAQGNALSQEELDKINNQPIAPQAKTQINKPQREPSFRLDERDGTQVREYSNKGRQTDIQVKSGFGTRYDMSKPEDSSPKIRDHDVNRVPSVNLKF